MRKPSLLIIPCLALLTLFSFSSQYYGIAKVEHVRSVYDGDTFRVDIAGWPPIVGDNMPIRIFGIDCPEMNSKDPDERYMARKAREFTKNKLLSAEVVYLVNMQRGKYFRIVAIVLVDGKSLGDMLLEAGLAKPYGK